MVRREPSREPEGGVIAMALSPFRGFSDMQSEVDRLFNEMVGDLFRGRRGRGAASVWSPAMEAYASNGDLVLRFDLPGVFLEDVDITLEDHTLTVSGVRKGVAEEAPHYLLELPYGEFRRSVTVPEGSDADSIKASLKDGVLEIVLPGATAEAEPKKIAIETA
jgi:HSP20 family protein